MKNRAQISVHVGIFDREPENVMFFQALDAVGIFKFIFHYLNDTVNAEIMNSFYGGDRNVTINPTLDVLALGLIMVGMDAKKTAFDIVPADADVHMVMVLRFENLRSAYILEAVLVIFSLFLFRLSLYLPTMITKHPNRFWVGFLIFGISLIACTGGRANTKATISRNAVTKTIIPASSGGDVIRLATEEDYTVLMPMRGSKIVQVLRESIMKRKKFKLITEHDPKKYRLIMEKTPKILAVLDLLRTPSADMVHFRGRQFPIDGSKFGLFLPQSFTPFGYPIRRTWEHKRFFMNHLKLLSQYGFSDLILKRKRKKEKLKVNVVKVRMETFFMPPLFWGAVGVVILGVEKLYNQVH